MERRPPSSEASPLAHTLGTAGPGTEVEAASGPVASSDGPPSTLGRGTALGRYLLLEPLAAGAMGVVYKAYDAELDRRVAIKLVHPERQAGEDVAETRARLLREAKALAQVDHPNVVPVYDAGTFFGEVFIAMAYVEGQTLTAWLKEAPRSWQDIVHAFAEAGRGLLAAHRAGLVHRDFKPSNVLVGHDGAVRVLDFGLARPVEIDPRTEASREELPASSVSLQASLTRTGRWLGTPYYMAPEQWLQERVDARTDQFSFCAALYGAVYGEHPFAGTSEVELGTAIVEGRVRPAPRNAAVPPWLRAVLLRGLSVRPEDRFPSLQELLVELTRDRRPRWPRVVLAMGAVLLVASGVGAVVQARRAAGLVCRGAEQKLEGVWDDATRSAVRAAMGASGAPHAAAAYEAVAKELDGYTRGWVAMHTAACEATHVRGEQSGELLDRRMHCLAQRLNDVRSLKDVLLVADGDLLERAPGIAASLTSLDGCADVEALTARAPLPKDPAARKRIEDLDRDLSQVVMLVRVGRERAAMTAAQTLARNAGAVGYRPIQAKALLIQGLTTKDNGSYREAVGLLHEAAMSAEAASDDEMLIRAWTELGHVHAEQLREPEEGRRFLRYAEARLERVPHRLDLAGDLYDRRARALYREGKYVEAEAEARRGLELQERAHGHEHTDVASMLGILGNAVVEQGKYGAAIAHYREAIRILEALYGPDNADVLRNGENLAVVLERQGDSEAALATLEGVMAAAVRAHGENDGEVVDIRQRMAVPLMNLGRFDAAEEHLDRALTLCTSVLPPDHDCRIELAVNRAELVRLRGRPAEAVRLLREALPRIDATQGPMSRPAWDARALLVDALLDANAAPDARREAERMLAIADAIAGKESPLYGESLAALGRCEVRVGNVGPGTTALERSVALLSTSPDMVPALANAKLALAQALAQDARRGAEASALARDARGLWSTRGARGTRPMAVIDAWLRGRP